MNELPALGIYVHWPYCARICPYCDFNVVRDRGHTAEQAALAQAILDDLEAHRALSGPRRLVSIYFGGGTPSLMDPDWAGRIIERARALWTPDEAMEITLEANPTDAESGRFQGFAAAGVQRLSLGLQSLDDAALALLGRNHDAREAIRAAETARAVFPRLSLDLIYARPGQTAPAWAQELKSAVALGAEHISPYQLTIETGTAFDRAVRRGALRPADPDLAADLYETTQAILSDLGFEAYEVSNHARGAGARSRHNLVYWRGQDYLGVGPGAHGRLTRDGARLATHATARVGDYLRAVAEAGVGWDAQEALSAREAAEERLLTGMRTVEGVQIAELAPLGLRPGHPTIADLVAAGLVQVSSGALRATAQGRLVLNRLVSELATAAA